MEMFNIIITGLKLSTLKMVSSSNYKDRLYEVKSNNASYIYINRGKLFVIRSLILNCECMWVCMYVVRTTTTNIDLSKRYR